MRNCSQILEPQEVKTRFITNNGMPNGTLIDTRRNQKHSGWIQNFTWGGGLGLWKKTSQGLTWVP